MKFDARTWDFDPLRVSAVRLLGSGTSNVNTGVAHAPECWGRLASETASGEKTFDLVPCCRFRFLLTAGMTPGNQLFGLSRLADYPVVACLTKIMTGLHRDDERITWMFELSGRVLHFD